MESFKGRGGEEGKGGEGKKKGGKELHICGIASSKEKDSVNNPDIRDLPLRKLALWE